jgi:hypothetical protein
MIVGWFSTSEIGRKMNTYLGNWGWSENLVFSEILMGTMVNSGDRM